MSGGPAREMGVKRGSTPQQPGSEVRSPGGRVTFYKKSQRLCSVNFISHSNSLRRRWRGVSEKEAREVSRTVLTGLGIFCISPPVVEGVSHELDTHSGPLAQLVEQVTFNHRVAGSIPARLTWPLRLVVRTPAFHVGDTGSNPVGVIHSYTVTRREGGRFKTCRPLSLYALTHPKKHPKI